MNNLKIFENDKFGNLRTYVGPRNDIWFVAKDICRALDLSNTTVAVGRLDEDERAKLNLGRQGMANAVNEFGLYNLVLASRKKEAKAFKRWVTHDVIPSIRKHGAYMTDEVIERTLSDPDYLISLARRLKEERAKRELAEAENIKNKPKVLFADTVSASRSSCLVGELAKLISQEAVRTGRSDKKIGQNTLFAWMRNKGYLCKSGERRNQPKQTYVEQGLFEIKKGSYVDSNGANVVTSTPKVTGKGQVYFVNKILG